MIIENMGGALNLDAAGLCLIPQFVFTGKCPEVPLFHIVSASVQVGGGSSWFALLSWLEVQHMHATQEVKHLERLQSWFGLWEFIDGSVCLEWK